MSFLISSLKSPCFFVDSHLDSPVFVTAICIFGVSMLLGIEIYQLVFLAVCVSHQLVLNVSFHNDNVRYFLLPFEMFICYLVTKSPNCYLHGVSVSGKVCQVVSLLNSNVMLFSYFQSQYVTRCILKPPNRCYFCMSHVCEPCLVCVPVRLESGSFFIVNLFSSTSCNPIHNG